MVLILSDQHAAFSADFVDLWGCPDVHIFLRSHASRISMFPADLRRMLHALGTSPYLRMLLSVLMFFFLAFHSDAHPY